MKPKNLFHLLFVFGLLAITCTVPAAIMEQSEAEPAASEAELPPTITPEVVAAAPTDDLPSNPTPEQSGEAPQESASQPEAAPTIAYDPAGLSAGAGSGSGRFISLDDPVLIPASQATWLNPDEIVMGVEQNGEAQAYPVSQMAYHHISNTTVGGEPYLVSY